MRLPPVYALFCLLVLGGFAAAKYQGWVLFTAASQAGGSSGSGGRGSGGFSGSHK